MRSIPLEHSVIAAQLDASGLAIRVKVFTRLDCEISRDVTEWDLTWGACESRWEELPADRMDMLHEILCHLVVGHGATHRMSTMPQWMCRNIGSCIHASGRDDRPTDIKRVRHLLIDRGLASLGPIDFRGRVSAGHQTFRQHPPAVRGKATSPSPQPHRHGTRYCSDYAHGIVARLPRPSSACAAWPPFYGQRRMGPCFGRRSSAPALCATQTDREHSTRFRRDHPSRGR